MPRRWSIEVRPWPKLRVGKRYPMQVLAVRRSSRPSGILVDLEHLCKQQAGRCHEVLLPLDVYPGNLTARFLKAAGLTIAIGENVCPSDAVGTTILITFGPSRDGAEPEPVAFTPVKERDDGEPAESADTAEDDAPEDRRDDV